MTLDVTGKDFHQTIAPRLAGTQCAGDDRAPGHTTRESLCAPVAFTPAFGNAGTRTVTATVTDANGGVVDTLDVARYTEGAPPIPTKVPRVRLVPKGTNVFAIWGKAGGGTTRYGSYLRLSDGRRLGHTAPKTCFAWRIKNVRPATAVTLRIQAGRKDLRFGGPVTTTLKARSRYAGPARLRNARIPRPCVSL
jgi:hypothetical protein